MKQKLFSFSLLLTIALFFAACTKGPGPGGRASIQGKVYAVNYYYDNAQTKFNAADSGYLGATKVYLSYGDEVGTGDNTDTDFDGIYSFDYLRPGKYTLWVFSKNLVNNSLDKAIVKTVEVTDKKGVVEVEDFKINTLKN